MKNNFNFNTWLENKDPEFYLSLIDEGFIPDWLRNTFLAGSMILGPLLAGGGEIHGAEYKTNIEVKKTNEKSGSLSIEVQVPLKIKNFDIAPDYIKSQIKNKILLFFKNQEQERLEKDGPNVFINLNEKVFVDIGLDRPDINASLLQFDLRELLPYSKFGDQDKLGRLLNVFLKPTEIEKKQGYHVLKFKIYYNKIPKQTNIKGNVKGDNPTQSKIVK